MEVRRAVAVLAALLAAAAAAYWWPRGEVSPPTTAGDATARASDEATGAAGVEAGQVRTAETTGTGDADARTAAPPPTFAIHGVVTKGGAPQRGRLVRCAPTGPGATVSATTGDDGGYRFAVAAGAYHVTVPLAAGAIHHQATYRRWPADEPSSAHAAHRRVDVVAADVRCDLALPTGALTVRALDATTWQPIAGATAAWGPPPPAMEEVRLATDAAGVAHFAEVGPGTHGVAAFARAFRLARQTVELRAGERAAVDLLLEPTGAIDVTLVDEADRPVEVPDGLEIRAYGVTYVTENEPTDPRELGQPDDPRTIEFDDLSEGRYQIELEGDHEVDDGERTIRFERIVAPTHAEVEVREGEVVRCRLRVRQRPLVRLRGAPRQGDPAAVALRLERLDEKGRARVLPSLLSSDEQRAGWHFQGHLAPGTYALTFTAGDRVWHETLQVDAASFERSFPLPW